MKILNTKQDIRKQWASNDKEQEQKFAAMLSKDYKGEEDFRKYSYEDLDMNLKFGIDFFEDYAFR